ncbi:MAG: AMP-binding protein [Desulfurispora sp.]|uniref:AMP-binding protein n=1 Tax=Desulfurispora sp. TaxID=3014275 RepID=UPI00404B9C95
MEKIWLKNWPDNLPWKLGYRLGEKPLHEYLRVNAVEQPDAPAYIYYGRVYTWRQLDQFTDSLAGFLADQGVVKGDRVVLYMQNCPQYIIAHYGVQKLGAVVVPASPMFKQHELAYEINDAGARVLVTTAELYPVVEAVRRSSGLEIVLVSNYRDFLPSSPTVPLPAELTANMSKIPDAFDLWEVINTHPAVAPGVTIDLWEDIALMVYTSGTTGLPKGAMLTYGNALFKTAATYHANNFQQDDVALAVMPVFHIAGMLMGVNIPVYGALTTCLLTRFDPTAVIAAIEQYRCTTWYSIVPMNLAIMGYPGVEKRDLTSLRLNPCTSFGVPLNQEIAGRWSQLTGGCLLLEAAYGLSETHTGDTFMPRHRVRYGTFGIPTYATEVRIVDPETGEDLPPGRQGEIVIRNPGVFKGYWNKPEATASTLREGWVYTGDIGMLDEEGYLHFLGRLKEMIKCSGYSVFPEEVEMLLLKHPAIQQVAVVGVPDPVRGESVKAFVVLKENYQGQIKPEEVIEWAKNSMAAYKYPRQVEFRDALPATGTGKVLRRLLKEEN